MILREYIKYLEAIIKEDSKILDLEVISSSDEEGNSYFKVWEMPKIGVYDRGQFYLDGMLEDEGYSKKDINVITVS